jgi:hypothetical protein
MENIENNEEIVAAETNEAPVAEAETVAEPVVEEAPVVEIEEPAAPVAEKKKAPVLGIISLVCGILGLLISCCCTWAAFPLFIAAIILAIVEKTKTGKMSGFAIAGLICGIVTIVSVIISIVFSAFISLGGFWTDLMDEMMYY